MSDSSNIQTASPRPGAVIERSYRASIRELWDLWTTEEGFESWWGPENFHVEVHTLEPRLGGLLHYDMIAGTPEMVAAMKQMGRPPSHETRATFSQFKLHDRLTLTHIIDFLPGVKTYESTIKAQFIPAGDQVRMVVTMEPMHNEEFTQMSKMGFTSQLTKLDERFHVEKA